MFFGDNKFKTKTHCHFFLVTKNFLHLQPLQMTSKSKCEDKGKQRPPLFIIAHYSNKCKHNFNFCFSLEMIRIPFLIKHYEFNYRRVLLNQKAPKLHNITKIFKSTPGVLINTLCKIC